MLSSDIQSEKGKNTGKTTGKTSGKTTTMTFRIDSDVMSKINDEAARGEISINALVNQILKRYVDWDMNEHRAGMVPLSKPVISHLFRKLTQEEVVMMSKDIAENAVYDVALFMKGKIDTNSFLTWFLSRMKTCSEISDNINENGSHTYILKHDLGGNWSLYHRSLLELIFTDFLHKPIRTSITDSTITLTVENIHD